MKASPNTNTAPVVAERFERYDELNRRGIPYSRVHLARLCKDKLFPRPVRLGGNRIAWLSSELDQWMVDRAAARVGGDA